MIMNDENTQKTDVAKKSLFFYADGRFYFTKEAERTFCFILSLLMLVGGVVYKLWI